jgi:hypothetical protein
MRGNSPAAAPSERSRCSSVAFDQFCLGHRNASICARKKMIPSGPNPLGSAVQLSLSPPAY